MYLLFLISTRLVIGQWKNLTPIVNTTSGRIRGQVRELNTISFSLNESLENKRLVVYQYTGIRYGRINPRYGRFMPAMPESYSEQLIMATETARSCWQPVDQNFNRFHGVEMWNAVESEMEEDCLHLNIFTPSGRKNDLYPVVVWVFGGFFNTGSISLKVYDGAYLAGLNDLVVVSINYRLGPFGFLYLDSNRAPGNTGLNDQLLAFQWIHDNIYQFGGDRTQITLMGESAGAMSISYHLQAQKSWPYFQRVILQSGNFFTPQAFSSPSKALEQSLELAFAVGCQYDEIDSIIECLHHVPPKKLVGEMGNLKCDNLLCMPFVPTQECSNGPLIQTDPRTSKSKEIRPEVEIMMGTNNNEASAFLVYALNFFYKLENISFHLFDYRPRSMSKEAFKKFMKFLVSLNDDNGDAIDFYCQNIALDGKSTMRRYSYFDRIEHCVADYLINCPTRRLMDYLTTSKNVPVYMYAFDYRSFQGNPWPHWMGIIHGYEIEFVFGKYLDANRKSDVDDILVTNRLMRYYVNFFRSGNPNAQNRTENELLKWPRWADNFEYLKINKGLSIEKDFKPTECFWWNNIFDAIRIKREKPEGNNRTRTGCLNNLANKIWISFKCLAITVYIVIVL